MLERLLLCWALSAPFILACLFVRTYAVDTPLSDDFTTVLALQLLKSGKLGIVDILLAQHNEHKYGLPFALMLALARLTHYNTVSNMYLGLAFLGATIALVLFLVNERLRRVGITAFALIPVAWLICGLRQAENLLMSFQGLYESIFFLILSLYLLDGVKRFGGRFYAAIAAAVLSAFSFGNGLLALPIGSLLLTMKWWLSIKENGYKDSRNKLILATVWTVSAIAIVCAYFYRFNYFVGQGKATRAFLLEHSSEVWQFALGFLASPIARAPGEAILIGILFLYITILVVYALFKKANEFNSILILPIMLIIYALLSACMVAYSRVQLGMEASLVSRYATVAAYGWLGLYLLLLCATELKPLFRYCTLAVILLCLGKGILDSYINCHSDGLFYRGMSLRAENVIRSYRLQGPGALNAVTGVPARDVVPLIEFLEKNKLSLFRRSSGDSIKSAACKSTPVPYWASIDRFNNALIEDGDELPVVTVNSARDGEISLSGWVADTEARKLPASVSLFVGGDVMVPAASGLLRADIARALKDDCLLSSGFMVSCRLDLIGRGRHEVKLRILSDDGKEAYVTPTLLYLNVL